MVKKINNTFALSLPVLVFQVALTVGCATERKIYIMPPVGYSPTASSKPVTYKTVDHLTGESRTLELPVDRSPEVLQVVENEADNLVGITLPTKADQDIANHDEKFEESTEKVITSESQISYVKSVEHINSLYAKKRYTQALVGLAPLVEQYPKQVKLYLMQGTIYRKINEPALALKAYKKAAGLDENNIEVQTVISRLETEVGSQNE